MDLHSHSHAVDSHSFPFPSLSFIPIAMGFPLGYSHSHPIRKHSQQKLNINSRATEDSATENWTLVVEK